MRLSRIIIPLLLISTFMCGCQKNSPDPSEDDTPVVEPTIRLSQTSITLSEDKTFQLEVDVDEELKGKMLFWTMRDEDIATVEDGLVTAIKEGSTICTVQCGKAKAKCAINVTSFEPENALSIHLTKNEFNLNVNDVFDLPITVSFGEQMVTDYTLIGEADDQSVAKIENNAIVALATGTTEIVLSAQYADSTCLDVITVNVF